MAFRIGIFLLIISSVACKKVAPVEREISLQQLPASLAVSDLCFKGDTLWAATGARFSSGELLASTDDGVSWDTVLVSPSAIRELHQHETTQYLVTSGNVLYASTNGGASWGTYLTPQSRNFSAVRLFDDTSAIMVGGENFGFGFVVRFNPTQAAGRYEVDTLKYELTDLAQPDPQTTIAVGYGVILRSTDQGLSWSQAIARGDYYKAVHFPTPQTGYVIGDYGSIWKTTNTGVSWNKIKSGSTLFNKARLEALYFINAEKGVVTGQNGILWLTHNGGASWEAVEDLDENDFSAVVIRKGRIYVGTETAKLISLPF